MQKEDHGGYAGIRVPWIDSNDDGEREEGEQAELNLYGEGTVIAIGGDAGEGGGAVSGNTGGGRRRWSRSRDRRKPEAKVEMLILLYIVMITPCLGLMENMILAIVVKMEKIVELL